MLEEDVPDGFLFHSRGIHRDTEHVRTQAMHPEVISASESRARLVENLIASATSKTRRYSQLSRQPVHDCIRRVGVNTKRVNGSRDMQVVLEGEAAFGCMLDE